MLIFSILDGNGCGKCLGRPLAGNQERGGCKYDGGYTFISFICKFWVMIEMFYAKLSRERSSPNHCEDVVFVSLKMVAM